jgi:hypothetical protein
LNLIFAESSSGDSARAMRISSGVIGRSSSVSTLGRCRHSEKAASLSGSFAASAMMVSTSVIVPWVRALGMNLFVGRMGLLVRKNGRH